MTEPTNMDKNYAPGGAYDRGYQDRYGGKERQHIIESAEREAYNLGWRDADMKIVAEARKRNGMITESGCCKKFIQD